MPRNKGKRYDDEPKLNMKKVFALIIAIVVIIMSIISLNHLLKQDKTNEKFSATNEYLTVYTNEKWGVINSKGELVIPAEYDEIIVIPDKTKPIFICTYDINYENGTYKTKVLDEKNGEILKDYNQVEAIDNYNSLGDIWYESNILKYEKNKKYGLIDFSGKVILNAEYDDIYSLKGIERSIIIEKDGKKGLVNNVTGEIIIEPKYIDISSVSDTYDNGYIIQEDSGLFGIIGPDKKVILEPKYERILNVAGNNMYVITIDNQEKLINNKGEVVLEEGFDEIVSIYGENIIAKKDESMGILGTDGTIKVDFSYEDIKHAFSDLYIAKKNEKYGVIKDNQIMIDFKYNSMTYIKSADIIKAEKENYETDLIDRYCNVKLSGIVSELNTDKGYIRIRNSGEYKYYNFNFEEKKNKDVLAGNTLFLVKNNGKYGYENKNGELVVDYIYDDATEQNKYGFCSVKKDGLWGALKSDGTVIVEPSEDLSNNLYVDFIGQWHLHEDLDLNVYTK